ncbi:MAG TPA: hypothetical protein VMV72_14795 [Verrucomicrobiae bacterium]|nr:hypothetical protein [Verrucomicrobiae bacterium]
MSPDLQLARLLLYAAEVVFCWVRLALWAYAFVRTRLTLWVLLIIGDVIGLGVALILLTIAWDRSFWVNWLGASGFASLSVLLLLCQIIAMTVRMVGFVLLVKWVCGLYSNRGPQPSVPS